MDHDELTVIVLKLNAEAERLADLIDAPRDLRLSAIEPTGNGSWISTYYAAPRYEDDEEAGHYLSLEEREDGRTSCACQVAPPYADQLLLALFRHMTHLMVTRSMGPATGEDRRPYLFSKQEQLLAQLNPAWAREVSKDHARILTQRDCLSS
jgi:hypothetical protein